MIGMNETGEGVKVKWFRRGLLIAATIGIASVTPGTAMAACDGTWQFVPSPNHGSSDLLKVAAASRKDVWVLGEGSKGTIFGGPLFEHWNGSRWKIMPSPSLRLENTLVAMTRVPGTSPARVWAAGAYDARAHTLVERWNGSAWKLVPTPKQAARLNGIVARSRRNIWAVGVRRLEGLPGVAYPLAMRWNGYAWKIASTPLVQGFFDAVTFVPGSRQLWAVGTDASGGALTARWNGTSWRRVANPFTPAGLDANHVDLNAVTALSPTNVWVAGSYSVSAEDGGHDYSFVAQWNGSSWEIAPSATGILGARLSAITAVSSDDVWAVGWVVDELFQPRALALHWDGSNWSVVSTAKPSSISALEDVAHVPNSNKVWAVGALLTSGPAKTLTERYC
jgi:hypothetical protein